MPDGVLINGKGPYQYNASVPNGINYETINVDPGNTKAVLRKQCKHTRVIKPNGLSSIFTISKTCCRAS